MDQFPGLEWLGDGDEVRDGAQGQTRARRRRSERRSVGKHTEAPAEAESVDHAAETAEVRIPRARHARRAEAPAEVADPVEYWGRSDLRRRRSRELADEILGQSAALAPEDGALLRAVFLDHKPMTELAALTRMPVRAVRRHVRELVRRVTSPEFAFVVRHSHAWPEQRRRVAQAVVVMGKSYRQTGWDLGLSLHAVRCHSASVYAMCEAAKHLASEIAAARLAESTHA